MDNSNLQDDQSSLEKYNGTELIKLAHTKMPFGKYEGYYLIDIPEYYMVWIHNNRLPQGKLGEQLRLVYELKLNGLEDLIRNIRSKYPNPFKV